MKKQIFDDEFYIGYLPMAPRGTAQFVRVVILCIGLTAGLVCIFVVTQQSQFSSSNFEYGKLTELRGDFVTQPTPHLRVNYGVAAATGKPIIKTVPLVAKGKFGLNRYGSEITKLQNKHVRLKGFLIYGDGKLLMQVNNLKDVEVIAESKTSMSNVSHLQQITVLGEVVDPKCYFGVMKPGEGKPHRSCAIRCIAGGIPPVFHQAGTSNYFLLTDEQGNQINEKVLGIVGDITPLTGYVVNLGDWSILRLSSATLRKISLAIPQETESINNMSYCSAH